MERQRKGWWELFKKSLQIYKKGGDKYIGSEPNGNKYYERMLGDKLKRYYINEEEMNMPIHPYWRSWLSYRRKEPPTEQEIQLNLERIKQIKQKASDLYERDLERFPEYAEKVKKAGDVRSQEDKKNYPNYKDLIQ